MSLNLKLLYHTINKNIMITIDNLNFSNDEVNYFIKPVGLFRRRVYSESKIKSVQNVVYAEISQF